MNFMGPVMINGWENEHFFLDRATWVAGENVPENVGKTWEKPWTVAPNFLV